MLGRFERECLEALIVEAPRALGLVHGVLQVPSRLQCGLLNSTEAQSLQSYDRHVVPMPRGPSQSRARLEPC